MTHKHTLALLVCLTLIFATGCEQTSIAEQEAIKNAATLQASTPSPTPSPTHTPSPSITPVPPTPSPTVGPSPTPSLTPTPTVTPIPTLTPLPPTPTPNPALAQFSLCTQTAGAADGGRFSARINSITTTLEPAFDRVTIGLTVPTDSAPPHAVARCLSAADDVPGAVGPYTLLVDLDGWLHDAAFTSTTISPTQALSGTTALKSLTLRSDANAVAGATLAFGMDQPLAYRLTLESNPYRLVLEVAKSGAVGQSNDMLSVPAGGAANPAAPLFYLQDGDVWKFAGGKATNLTANARAGQYGAVTEIAANPRADTVVFCATAPGADVGDRLPQSALWSIAPDGASLQNLSGDVLACADPVFAPDGKTVAFTATETDADPPRFGIWTVSADGGDARRLTVAGDEWSRFAPQWLGGARLVYAARAEDGRGTLFVHSADNRELDIGADVLKGETYRALGRPLAAPDGSAIAVEGLRANDAGADVLLIDPDGAQLPSQGPIGDGYWNRPLAWNDEGALFYLSVACSSDVAQSYSLHARSLKNGAAQLLAAGTSLGDFGSFVAVGKGLAYVTLEHALPRPRGPRALDTNSASVLWFWDIGGGTRAKLASAQSAIGDLAP